MEPYLLLFVCSIASSLRSLVCSNVAENYETIPADCPASIHSTCVCTWLMYAVILLSIILIAISHICVLYRFLRILTQIKKSILYISLLTVLCHIHNHWDFTLCTPYAIILCLYTYSEYGVKSHNVPNTVRILPTTFPSKHSNITLLIVPPWSRGGRESPVKPMNFNIALRKNVMLPRLFCCDRCRLHVICSVPYSPISWYGGR